jgi:hypothetical protein
MIVIDLHSCGLMRCSKTHAAARAPTRYKCLLEDHGRCSAEHFSVARRALGARLDLTVNFARFVRQQNGDAVSDRER